MTTVVDLIKLYPLIPVVGLLVFDSIAMSHITTFAHTLSGFNLLVASIFEIIAWVFLVFMIRYRGLAVSNAIWDVGSLIIVTSIAILQFKEKLIPRHYFGIILGIISMLMLLEKE